MSFVGPGTPCQGRKSRWAGGRSCAGFIDAALIGVRIIQRLFIHVAPSVAPNRTLRGHLGARSTRSLSWWPALA